MDASLALQKAVYTALSGDATLAALVTGVWDEPPAGAAFPYIEIAEIDAVDNAVSLSEGLEHRIEVQIWSGAAGKSEIFAIMERVDALLHNAALSPAGHNLINLQRTNRLTFRDADPSIRRGVMSFRAVTEEL